MAGILAALITWSRAAAAEPWWFGLGGTFGAAAFLFSTSTAVSGWLQARETKVAAGPLFVVSGVIVMVLCFLWAAIDFGFDLADAPRLQERLLLLLLPSDLASLLPAGESPPAALLDEDAVLRSLLGLSAGAPIGLHPAVRLPIALVTATGLYTGLVAWMGRALAEMKSLVQKPDDVLRRERIDAARRRREAMEAGLPIPDDAQAISLPLADDRFGRVYKWLGHWTSVEVVEPRFVRWQRGTLRSVLGVLLLAAPAAVVGALAMPLWIGAAIAVDGLFRNLRTPLAEEPEEPDPEPVGAEPAAGPEDHRPQTLIRTLEGARGALFDPPERAKPRDEIVQPLPDLDARHLAKELLDQLGLERLFAHQARAVELFNAGENVLLCTPPLSGRTVLADFLSLYAVLGNGHTVLVLAEDEAAAREAHARFDRRAEETHWKWNLVGYDLTARAGRLDPSRIQPSIVFADPNSLHRVVLGDSEQWRTWLSGLHLVVLPELQRRHGAVGAHLAHLMRRLDRAVARARSVSGGRALLPAEGQGRFVVVGIADPSRRDLGRFAARLVGQPFVVIGPDADGAELPPQLSRIVPPGELLSDTGHPALWVQAAAQQAGLQPAFFGYDDALTTTERGKEPDLADADLVIARASADRVATLGLLTCHAGWRSDPLEISDVGGISRPRALVLWVPDREPFAELLAEETRSRLRAETPVRPESWAQGPSLVATPDAPEVQRVHLRCTLAEDEVAGEDLTRVFARDLLLDELGALRERGQLVERNRRVLDVDGGRVRRVRTYTMTGGGREHEETSLAVAGPSSTLVDVSTGETLRELPRARALALAYPGRVFVLNGIRYRVLPVHLQEEATRGQVLAEREDEPQLTTPMRRLALTLIERRSGPDRRRTADRRLEPVRNIGGVPFTLQFRGVGVTEEIVGLRRYSPDGRLIDASVYEQPVHATFDTTATLLGIPSTSIKTVATPTLHALAHVVRSTLPALVHHTEEDLEIGGIQLELPARTVPTVAFVDLHPGGAGFAAAITPQVIRDAVQWSRLLLQGCRAACKSPEGCPACLDTWRCHAPPEHYGQLDKADTLAVLAALLDG